MAAPIGNKYAEGRETRVPYWTNAIRRAVLRKINGVQRMQLIVDRLVNDAINGSLPAMQEISNRLEGKPVQPTQGSDSRLMVYVQRFPELQQPGVTIDVSPVVDAAQQIEAE